MSEDESSDNFDELEEGEYSGDKNENNEYHGFGKLVFPKSGVTFEGNFKNGVKYVF